MIKDTLKQIEETKKEVEKSYGMGGLSDGLYGDYATDVAKSSILKVLQQLVERVTNYTPDLCENSKAFQDDIISYLKSEIATLSTNIDKE